MASGNYLDQHKPFKVMALLYLPLQILLTWTWDNYNKIRKKMHKKYKRK